MGECTEALAAKFARTSIVLAAGTNRPAALGVC